MSNTSQLLTPNPASISSIAPKRQVTRVKKQTTASAVSTVSAAASTAPTFTTPVPTQAPEPVCVSADGENITISHSIRIIKDPVTNAYTYSYIGPNGDELLSNNGSNNGFNSDSNSNSSSDDDTSSIDSDDSNSPKNKYLLSTAKEIAEKLNTQTIDTEGCEPLYVRKQITHDILLPFILINMHASSRSNILALLHTTLVSCIEGRCISEGFIKPDSARIIDFKCGKIIGKNVQFNLVIECLICNPVEQTVICCFAKNITQAGIRALSADVHLPVVVYIARDYSANNPNIYYNSIKEGDAIKVRIIGKRFEINDKNIQIIGDLVVPKKERLPPHHSHQKIKQPPIVIDGTVMAATTTITSTHTVPTAIAATTTISKSAKSAAKEPKAPKAAKEPKAPKAPKAPKEPKEPKAAKVPKEKSKKIKSTDSAVVTSGNVSNVDDSNAVE